MINNDIFTPIYLIENLNNISSSAAFNRRVIDNDDESRLKFFRTLQEYKWDFKSEFESVSIYFNVKEYNNAILITGGIYHLNTGTKEPESVMIIPSTMNIGEFSRYKTYIYPATTIEELVNKILNTK